MTDHERDLMALRLIEIAAKLEALVEGRVVDGDPAEVEKRLLIEQAQITHLLGGGED